MKKKTILSCAAVCACLTIFAKPYAFLEKNVLKIGNDYIERAFDFNNGDLKTLYIADKKAGITSASRGKSADIFAPEEKAKAADGYFKTRSFGGDEISYPHLECEVGYKKGGLAVKRVFKIYENSPAIACEVFFSGKPSAKTWIGGAKNAADKKNIEKLSAAKEKNSTLALDTLDFSGKHWQLLAVEFFDATDHANTFTLERRTLSYRTAAIRGNLLFFKNAESGAGFFWLKESPCSSVQLAYPNADFFAEFGRFNLVGAGIDAEDVKNGSWTKAYGYAFGVWNGGDFGRLCALRKYQKTLRKMEGKRDNMVMLNTWGDRGQDKKVNEQFCKNEISLAEKIGVTHFQIDDGWQEGKSANSAFGGSFKNIWGNPDYWNPSKSKYPDGLTPVVEAAKKAGIELCLWFNPSVQNDFADWQKDVAAINKLFDEYGIRTFKIDGLQIPNKTSEERVRAIFDSVLKHTGNKAVFNLDATAGRRGGYFMFGKYGNIFLENRYTDWQNYYPYWTLRNLWQISKYVPAERLQMEFLNNARNVEKYGKDIFAPALYDIEYLFAITMAAQPLAWFEASGLSAKQIEKLSPLIRKYNAIAEKFHSGVILPVGEEPSGVSWTGFQSVLSDKEGFVIVYRENNGESSGKVKTWFEKGAKIEFSPILGKGAHFEALADEDGRIEFSLPQKNSFALWRYKISEK